MCQRTCWPHLHTYASRVCAQLNHNISWLAFICMRRRAQSSDPKYYMVIKSWAIVTCADYVDVVVVAGRETHRKWFGFFFSFHGPMAKQTHCMGRMWIAFKNFFSKNKNRSHLHTRPIILNNRMAFVHENHNNSTLKCSLCCWRADHVHLQFLR